VRTAVVPIVLSFAPAAPAASSTPAACAETVEQAMALRAAIDADDPAAVDAAVDLGACVDGRTLRDVPLVRAARGCRPAAIGALLARGANVHAREIDRFEDRVPPLVAAMASGCAAATLTALLDGGADPDARVDEYSRTPVEMAIASGENEVFDLLLSRGAGMPARALMAMRSDFRPPYGTSLHIVQGALAAGADANYVGSFELTPLFRAPRGDIVTELIAHGADVHARARNGESLLWQRYIEGSVDDRERCRIATALIDSGVDPRAENRDGDTALLYHARRTAGGSIFEYDCVVSSLLRDPSRVDVDARDFDGRTPLMYMAQAAFPDEPRLAVLQRLIDLGADVDARDADGKSVLQYASASQVRKLLVAAGADR
jgi:ankyrin repeat protein